MFNENKFIYSVVKILNDLEIPSEKIHMQKFISYLSDTIDGVPFSFRIYTYCPFCKELSSELNSLVAWNELKYVHERYHIPNESVEYLSSEKEETIKTMLKRYIAILPNYDFNTMELYGTMHYYMSKVGIKNKDEIFERFKIVKADKYTTHQIEECFSNLSPLFQ